MSMSISATITAAVIKLTCSPNLAGMMLASGRVAPRRGA
jgi:hypothetical protein